MAALETEVLIRGAVLEGRSPAIVHAACQRAEEALSTEGVNRVHARLAQVLQHPTGYYESRIVTDRAHGDAVVTDGDVIYGPWLEGVGSRNQSTSFKGYATFRTVGQELDREAAMLAEPSMAILRELNR